MSRIERAKILLLLAALALTPCVAQTPPTNPPPSAPPVQPKPPVVAQADAPTDNADARRCLDLATNLEVIACAEKYRARKARR
jgi:hypothetical protein